MNMYTNPVQASYTCRTRTAPGVFDTRILPVVVLGESEKSFLIRSALHGNRSLKVRKHNVRLHIPVDCPGMWWHD